MKNTLALALAAALFAASGARAADLVVQKDPEGVVTLNSSATVDVPKDWMSVSFSVTREGADAHAVQTALKEALDAALKQAQAAKEDEGRLEVRTGGFSLQPRYNQKGLMNGWTGTTELQVQGRDMPAIATLAGRITTMTIANLDYGVSREAREKIETELAAQAIAGFRAKAAAYAKAFGYACFTIREVNVQTDQQQGPPPRPFAAKAMSMAGASDALPTDAGKGSVTSNVNGSVTLVK
jgi:predicted secreted protein